MRRVCTGAMDMRCESCKNSCDAPQGYKVSLVGYLTMGNETMCKHYRGGKDMGISVTPDMKDTAEMMTSDDYKERFKAEYYQTKIRYERLKSLNTQIEAAEATAIRCNNAVKMPQVDCPHEMLERQQHIMGSYLHILEVRAVIEGIEL